MQAKHLGQCGQILLGEEERLWKGGDRARLRAGLGRDGMACPLPALRRRNVVLPRLARLPGEGVEGGPKDVNQAYQLVPA